MKKRLVSLIRFKEDYRKFKEGLYIEFRQGINILVGDNGTGKSTILKLLREDNKKILDINIEGYTSSYFIDMENTPRGKDLDKCDNRDYKLTVSSLYVSHGEANKAFLKSMTRIKESIILIDEPDMALSIKSINQLWKWLVEAKDNNNQIILSAHNPYIIGKSDMVYSLDHMKWICSKEYLSILE